MKCLVCQKETLSKYKFCIHCGSPLVATPEASPLEAEQDPKNTPALQLLAFQRELSRFRSVINSLDNRLAKLESLQGIPFPASQPTITQQPTEGPQPMLTEEPISEPVSDLVSVGSGLVPDSNVTSEDDGSASPPREAAQRKPIEWEQILGGNWMTRIGILTLVIGAAFFLKLAFDNQWSIPGVIVGITAGLALLLGGYHWRMRYPVFAQALTGGGLAYLYLSIYAALAIFHLISVYPALVAVLVVSLLSATLAVQQNSMALAILGILGAFSATLILGYQTPGESGIAASDHGIQMIAYVLIVDLGVLVLSAYRNWRWLSLLALVGSFISYGMWNSYFGATTSLLISEVSLTLIFLVFVGVTTLFHIIWRRVSSEADYALMILNAAYYFGVSYGLMWSPLRGFVGSFSLILALFYGILTYVASRRNMGRLSLFATGIALVFLTIAIPVQLGDRAVTTIAWVTEGAILMWFYLRLRLSRFRIYSYITFGLVGLRLLFIDTPAVTAVPVLNGRVLAFLFAIGVMYLTAYVAWRYGKMDTLPERNSRTDYPIFLVGANFFSLWLVGAEVIRYSSAPSSGNLIFILFIFMAGVTTLYHLLWRRPLQIFDIVALAVSAAFYFGMSIPLWGNFRAWMGSLYLLLAVFFGSLAYVLLRRAEERNVFGNMALGIGLAFLTVAIPVQFGDQPWTAFAWATEMAALMWLSFMLPMVKFRVYSYAVFVIMAARILLFDTAVDPSIYRPVINGRFLAFTVAIAATYLTGYQLWRRRRIFPDLAVPASTFFIAANIFSLWLLSFEIWDYLGSPLVALGSKTASENLHNTQSLSLTTLWAVYAVVLLVIGIAKRWRNVRLWALALLAVPLLKLFIIDVFTLQLVYRIIAFAGLGILLLIGGYLYQRYSKSIRGIIAKDDTHQ